MAFWLDTNGMMMIFLMVYHLSTYLPYFGNVSNSSYHVRRYTHSASHRHVKGNCLVHIF